MAINEETFEDLRKEIEKLRSEQPTLNSHEIWEHLVKNSDRQKPLEEITVEICLVACFDYPEEETVKFKATKANLEYMENDDKCLMEFLKNRFTSTKPIQPATKSTQSESEDIQSDSKDTESESEDIQSESRDIHLGAEYTKSGSRHTALEIDQWISVRGNLALQVLRDINPGRSYNDIDHKLLFRRIQALTSRQPKLSSREIWRRLNEEPGSQNSLEEVVVEAWLLVAFDYPIEKLVQIKAHEHQVRQYEEDRLNKDLSAKDFIRKWYAFLMSNPNLRKRVEDLDTRVLVEIHDLWFHNRDSSSRWIWGELNRKPNGLMPLKEIVVEACLVANGYLLANTIQLKNQENRWWQETEILRYETKDGTFLAARLGEGMESMALFDNKLNLKKVVKDIKELRRRQPTLSPRQIWVDLDKPNYWPAPLLEIAVEACLIKFCGIRPEDTTQLESLDYYEVPGKRFLDRVLDYCFGSHKLGDASCACCGSAKIVEKSEIEHYRKNGRVKVDPKTTRAVGLLRIMLDTKYTIRSFLPINTPTALAIMPYQDMNASQRVYALFYAEWDAWMGPSRPIHPPVDYVAGAEKTAIVDSGAYPNCQDELPTWTPESPMSFEVHVQCALISTCWGYRGSIDWLTFAMKRTRDPDTIKMINSVFAGFFGLKMYHMGGGFIEYHNWHNDWFHSFRVSHGIVAFVREKVNSPEVMWAERDEEGKYTAHYEPRLMPIGVSTPVLKARDKVAPPGWDFETFGHGHWTSSND
ncbi:uncharacterized protein EAE97_011984 [Botrytis byssoidea]|uniref:Uncharacterized protein n=1 Tax=Botrytis byssoidea TaxID=139641 RepID=A0A9P5HN50_9HELO|nr:uncharacterized protein EAE97_011984 [Botrytis byssoidea]KAF7917846.1 hypothetical protein EAE97_011984 [Botrytis byssoidea]